MLKRDLSPGFTDLAAGLPGSLEKKVIDPADAPPPPAPRPWYARFLERKFMVPVLLILVVIVGVASGTIPWGWEVVAGVVGLVWAWIRGEVALDLARIKIPQAPGPWDDIARALQMLALIAAGEKPPASADSTPPS